MRLSSVNTAILVAFCGLLFLTNLWGYDLWSPDEPRFGEVAREMMQSGDYLAPQINGGPYKEKPPMLFWLIALFSAPFGDVSELTARMPSVLGATLAVLCAYWLGRRMYGERVGLWAGIVLATSAMFWWEARTCRTDMPLTAFLAVNMLSLWCWHESKRTGWLVLFYASLAAAGLSKGPPAIVFPLCTLIVFYWGRKAERKQTHWVIGTIISVAIVLAWLIPARMAVSGGESAQAANELSSDFLRQVVGRAVMGISKAQWPWYYLVQAPMTLFPWIIFMPWAVRWVWQRRREDDRMRFLLAATVPAFIFFSIVIGKRTMYLMPIYPALAILIARSMLDLVDTQQARWLRPMGMVWVVVLVLAAIVPLVIPYTESASIWSPAMYAVSCVALGFAVDAIRRVRAGGKGLHAASAGYFTGLVLVAVIVALPAINPEKSARDICSPLRALVERGVDYRLYSLCFSREQYIFYAKKFHTPVLTEAIDVGDYLAGKDVMDVIKQQRRLRKAITEAAEDVPISDFTAVTAEEVAALDAAHGKALAEFEGGPAAAEPFEKPLREAIATFRNELAKPEPAFFFVQEEDWRWILPIVPEFRALPVVRVQPVGSRKVLLIANGAGAELARN